MFLNTAIGYPGSMHDARVLWNSELYRKVVNGNILREPVVNYKRKRYSTSAAWRWGIPSPSVAVKAVS